MKRNILLIMILIICISLVPILTGCANKDMYFAKTTVYKIEQVKLMDLGGIVNILMDFDESKIIFYPNGKCEIYLMVKSGVLQLLSVLPAALGAESLSSFASRDFLDDFNDSYLDVFFPGFDFENLMDSLKLLDNTLGISLVGLDDNSKLLQAIDLSLKEGGELPDELPEINVLGIKYEGPYFRKTVKSEVTGISYKGVFLGKDRKNTNPYFGLTMRDDDSLHLRVELVDLDVTAIKV